MPVKNSCQNFSLVIKTVIFLYFKKQTRFGEDRNNSIKIGMPAEFSKFLLQLKIIVIKTVVRVDFDQTKIFLRDLTRFLLTLYHSNNGKSFYKYFTYIFIVCTFLCLKKLVKKADFCDNQIINILQSLFSHFNNVKTINK